ncbi:MAG: biotin/lipoyl-containing protein [bacterium]
MAPGKAGRSRSSEGRLVSLFNRYYSLMLEKKINEFRFQEGDLKIYIRRAQAGEEKPAAPAAGEQPRNKKFIRSPLTGIFYASSSPNTSAYVTPPCEVKKGDILCVIEAMKVMNEIESPDDGRVLETIAKNAELVTKGDPLFEIE